MADSGNDIYSCCCITVSIVSLWKKRGRGVIFQMPDTEILGNVLKNEDNEILMIIFTVVFVYIQYQLQMVCTNISTTY